MYRILPALLICWSPRADAGRVTGVSITPTTSVISTTVEFDITLYTSGQSPRDSWVLGQPLDANNTLRYTTFGDFGYGFGGTTYQITNYFRSDWNTNGDAALDFGDNQSARQITLDRDGTASGGRVAYRGTFTHSYAPGGYTAWVRVTPTGTFGEPGLGPATFSNPAYSPSTGVAFTGTLVNRYVQAYGIDRTISPITWLGYGSNADTYFYNDTVLSVWNVADFTVTEPLDGICGDGELNDGEECDDGNTEDGDGCAGDCTSECGNGQIDGRETCDDGNRNPGDGCDADCQLECGNGRIDEPEECDDGNREDLDGCDQFCDLECGNGVIEGLETCDDGNTLDGDGCSSSCFEEFNPIDTDDTDQGGGEGGCSCATPVSSAPWWTAALVGLVWTRRRRR